MYIFLWLKSIKLAYQSAIAMSHANILPRVHGMKVAPSGVLLTDFKSPTGSFTDENCAFNRTVNDVIHLSVMYILQSTSLAREAMKALASTNAPKPN